MEFSKYIKFNENDKKRILDCFTFLRDSYAPNENEYNELSKFIDAVEKDELTKNHLNKLHDLGNGAELVKMVVKAYYKNDVSRYKDEYGNM